MELGARLKQARLEAGLSQRQLCGDVITRNMLSQIESGAARPSMDTLRHLAKGLGKPVSFFLEETVASVNQTRMDIARTAFADGQYAQALEELAQYQTPDAVFDAEYYLLRAMSLMELAQQNPEKAGELLVAAGEAGGHTPYYGPDLERRRQLLLTQTGCEAAAVVEARLSDEELLLRARAALAMGNPARCEGLLAAAGDQNAPPWVILRGDCDAAAGDYQTAVQWYRRVEGPQVYPKLEQCFLKLEDYKMAYHYACKQR